MAYSSGTFGVSAPEAEETNMLEVMVVAQNEIQRLARENELLRAKVEMITFFQQLIQPLSSPYPTQAPDIEPGWQLRRHIERLSTSKQQEKTK